MYLLFFKFFSYLGKISVIYFCKFTIQYLYCIVRGGKKKKPFTCILILKSSPVCVHYRTLLVHSLALGHENHADAKIEHLDI